jgi:hypothetical protein
VRTHRTTLIWALPLCRPPCAFRAWLGSPGCGCPSPVACHGVRVWGMCWRARACVCVFRTQIVDFFAFSLKPVGPYIGTVRGIPSVNCREEDGGVWVVTAALWLDGG